MLGSLCFFFCLLLLLLWDKFNSLNATINMGRGSCFFFNLILFLRCICKEKSTLNIPPLHKSERRDNHLMNYRSIFVNVAGHKTHKAYRKQSIFYSTAINMRSCEISEPYVRTLYQLLSSFKTSKTLCTLQSSSLFS